jgi:hypothetical protein
MPQNSTSQGDKTRQQQKAIINKDVETKGIDVDPHERPIAEARADMEQPAGEYEISHGDRSIKRGANQESEHHKRRDD